MNKDSTILEAENRLKLSKRSAFHGLLQKVSQGKSVRFRENGIRKNSIYWAAYRSGIRIKIERVKKGDSLYEIKLKGKND